MKYRKSAALMLFVIGLSLGCNPGKYTPGEVSDIGKTQKVEMLIFSAKWCGACKKVPPILEDVKPEFPHVVFREVDVDVNSQLAEQYRVSSIPHFELLVDGRSVGTFKGARSGDYIASFIRSHVR